MKKLFTLFVSAVAALVMSAAVSAKAPSHVVFIGLDGWGSYTMPKADMPNVKGLMARGAWTLKKRSVLPSSSAINWASIFMGVGTEGHGYTDWGSRTPEIPSIALSKNGIFPTIFTILSEQKPGSEAGVIYEWVGIPFLVDSLSTTYHKHVPAGDNNDSGAITAEAVRYIKEAKPVLAAIIYDNPDHVGHTAGHDTPELYDIMAYLDGRIGEIIQATKDAGIYDETVFIISSDHGGINKGHGGKTLQEMETPLIMAGPGIKNTGELKSAVMQFDIAPTIARLLGLSTPQPWIGRPVAEALSE